MRTTWEKKNLAEKRKRKRKRVERCRIFFLEFLEIVSARRKPRKSWKKREVHFVKSFSLAHCRWWTKGRHEQLRFVRKQIGEPLCPIDSIDRRSNRGASSFGEEREREREKRFGSRVVTEEIRRRRWGEVHPGRCISVITERDPIRGGRPPLFPSCNTFLTRVYALPPSFLCILFFLLPIQRYSLWSKLRFRDKREFWYDIS